MPRVQIKNNQVYVGSKPVPLLSGEVHYWRLNPKTWKSVLDEVRAMGLKIISTYVPWDYHEYQRGSFDFTGKTDKTRDLKAFLTMTRREGFWVIIRPGPYIYSEWPNGGVPSYAYKHHRLHPAFLKDAENYLQKVVSVIQPFFASIKGGHIILLQADNEIDPFPDIFGHQMGLNGKPGAFQSFIEQKYGGNLDQMNKVWGSDYKSFKRVGPYIACMFKEERGLPLKGDKELKRNLDYFEFKYDYTLKCAKWNVETYRKLGVDVPIYLNLYPFFYVHDWSQMQSTCDMVGIDLYPSSELMEDKHEQRKFIDKVRFLRRCSTIPFIAEFAAGVWHARHYESGVLTPNHYRLICLSALLGGAMGWNWYMLVNRDNWYMSPINEWGRRRSELFDVFKQMVDVYLELKPPSLTKLTDIAVTHNPLQHAARTLPQDSLILTYLYDADIDYELFDPSAEMPKKKIVFYSGNQWISQQAHHHLKKFVERGGVLVCFRSYPRKDENFERYNVLGLKDPKEMLFEFRCQFQVSLDGRRNVDLNSSVYVFPDGSDRSINARLGVFGKRSVGYIKKLGKGRILHLGVEPTRDLLLEILRYFNVSTFTHSTTTDIKTGCFKRANRYYVIAVNNGKEDKSGLIYLYLPGRPISRFKVKNLVDQSVRAYVCPPKGSAFNADIRRKDGAVYEIIPS